MFRQLKQLVGWVNLTDITQSHCAVCSQRDCRFIEYRDFRCHYKKTLCTTLFT